MLGNLRRKSRIARGALLMVFALTRTGVTHAATEQERSAARDLAEQGAQLYESGRYQEAYDHFSRASELVQAPTVLLFLARSATKLGKLIKAREAYKAILRQQVAADAPSAFKDARTAAESELAAIEPRIARVTIDVKGAEGREARVAVDGVEMNRALLNVPQPVDPGSHRFDVSGAGLEGAKVEKAIAEGAKETVVLQVRVLPGAAPAPAPVATPSGSTGDEGVSKPTPVLGYVALGVGAVGLGFGGFMGLRHFSKKGDSNDKFDECDPRRCTDDEKSAIESLDDEASTAGLLSIAGLAVGAAGVGVGLYLVLTPSSHPDADVALRFSPTGASVVGKF